MPGHQEPKIIKVINSNQDTLDKMNKLLQSLEDSLKDEWKKVTGIDLPTIADCEIFKLDTALLFASQVKVDDFLNGAVILSNAAFNGDQAAIAQGVIQVAQVGIQNVIGGGTVQIGVHGNSAKVKFKNDTYLAACYASTQFASAQQWGVQEDFYVAKYVYLVKELHAVTVSHEITMF